MILNKLNDNILSIILSFTNYESMYNIKLVCKRWNMLSNTDHYYENILITYCKKRIDIYEFNPSNYILISEHDKNRTWIELFQLKKIIPYNNKTKKIGTKYLPNGEEFYEGELKNGRPCGIGCLYKKCHGLYYIGNFTEGRISGYGKKILHNGDIYDGYFFNICDGEGKIYFVNGSMYAGKFSDNRGEGDGIYHFKNGSVYNGMFKNGKRNEKGIYYYSNGDIYTGNWINNKKNGIGSLKTKYLTYFGQWKHSKATGHCEIFYKNGNYYKGDIVKGVQNGLGSISYKNGVKYDGYFKNGLPAGFGIMKFINKKYSGCFNGYNLNGNTIITYNNFICKGYVKEFKENGIFTISDYKNNCILKGNFIDGLFESYNFKNINLCNKTLDEIIEILKYYYK